MTCMIRNFVFATMLTFCLSAGAACGESPETSDTPSATLHEQCTGPDECDAPQECAERSHPEGAVQTCEIPCDATSDCPSDHECHTIPCVPDDVMCGYCAPAS